MTTQLANGVLYPGWIPLTDSHRFTCDQPDAQGGLWECLQKAYLQGLGLQNSNPILPVFIAGLPQEA